MTNEAWLAVIAICGTFLTLAGVLVKVGWQRPSKELLDIIKELRTENTRLFERVAKLEAKDEERDKQIYRAQQAFDYLTQEVEHEFPTAVKIAREIMDGSTVRNVKR